MADASVLIQRRGIHTRTYTLTDNEVIVRERGILVRRENRIPYALLSSEHFAVTVTKKRYLWFGFVFLSLGLLVLGDSLIHNSEDFGKSLVVYVILAALCQGMFWLSRQRFIGFQAGRVPLAFWPGKPSVRELQEFLTVLDSKKREFLRRNYLSRAIGGSPADELQKLLWLKENGGISEAEFEILKRRVIYGAGGEEEKEGSEGR